MYQNHPPPPHYGNYTHHASHSSASFYGYPPQAGNLNRSGSSQMLYAGNPDHNVSFNMSTTSSLSGMNPASPKAYGAKRVSKKRVQESTGNLTSGDEGRKSPEKRKSNKKSKSKKKKSSSNAAATSSEVERSEGEGIKRKKSKSKSKSKHSKRSAEPSSPIPQTSSKSNAATTGTFWSFLSRYLSCSSNRRRKSTLNVELNELSSPTKHSKVSSIFLDT